MIAILKYNAGNVRSVANALSRLGYSYCLTDDKNELRKAEKVILPGVGEAGSAMRYLKEKELDIVIQQLDQPVLGICLGLQLLCRSSEESNTSCLGIFNAAVKKFPSGNMVPHTGWNNIRQAEGLLFQNTGENDDFYFVHSYYAGLCEDTIAVCDYILPFSAALQKNNFYATQFHPERSAGTGEKILKNFLQL